jgi:hypothetical protein
VTNQDIDGKVPPASAAGTPAAPKGAPDTLEQQLEKEREARALMRERLRTTEALAAESHALRAQMAQELERVTADRDRLRTEAAAATTAAPGAARPAAPRSAGSRPVEPQFTPTMLPPDAFHAADRPLKPPPSRRRTGPWGALAMLGVVAAAVAAVGWYKGSLPGLKELQTAMAPTAGTTQTPTPARGDAAPAPRPVVAAAPAASMAVAKAAPTGPVALPPASPEAQLAAAPPAAGPTAVASTQPATGTSPAEMAVRLRKALDGEGIASPVDVEAATGRVQVTDPKADDLLRQRTETVIRSVYAGASLPEPEIEHRWLAPKRGVIETTASTASPVPAPAAPPAPDTRPVARQAALSRSAEHRKAMEVSVADAEELTPVLPAGRVTASCMDGLVGKGPARRANMSACMKHSCCSSAANHNSEECRAYERAYPFTCGAG